VAFTKGKNCHAEGASRREQLEINLEDRGGELGRRKRKWEILFLRSGKLKRIRCGRNSATKGGGPSFIWSGDETRGIGKKKIENVFCR